MELAAGPLGARSRDRPAADRAQIEMARKLGARAVEIQTARYSEARGPAARERELESLREAARYARERGLHVHLGHGLTYTNVKAVTALPGVEELNIGHSIVSRAVLVGMERAVREMKQVMQEHYPNPNRPT